MLSVAPGRTSEDLDLLFGALADSTRRGMVERLDRLDEHLARRASVEPRREQRRTTEEDI